jgi:hypothetical protein
MTIIGIDPDCKESGFAEFCPETKELNISKMKFFDMYEYLKANRERITLVRIEAGWLNEKSNFHHSPGQSKSAGERIAKNVGSNHETGRKIAEMCEHLQMEYELVLPLGTKGIDHFLFKRMTGFPGRTNQDMRDAGCLVWDCKLNKRTNRMKKKETPKTRPDCRICRHAEGYENYMTRCVKLGIKRPYGIRECKEFEELKRN